MPISRNQARDIAKVFFDLSHELGAYRFTNWGHLTPTQRRQIEDIEWDLLNYSSNFVTTAVGIVLHDMHKDLKAITDATAKAKKAVVTIQAVKDVLSVATALVVLGGAITSHNPLAIAGAAVDLLKVAEDTIGKHNNGNE